MRINHNSMALNASDHFATLNKNLTKSMARLSSGSKITSPADDAAGLAISTKMNEQIKGLDRASLNSNDGISVIQSAEGGLNEIHAVLGRMRELAVQAANDVYFEEDRDAIQEEIDALADQLTQIAETTDFNDQKLLDGSTSRRTLSSVNDVQITYMSTAVNKGIYELEVTEEATKAKYESGFAYSDAKITKEQAGTIVVNGFSVEIKEDMTMTEVFDTLQEHLHKIDIDVIASNDGGATEEEFESGASVVFVNKHEGADERVEIKIGNEELASALGMDTEYKSYGTDCEVALSVTDGGFTATASVTTDGNDVKVVDRNGFEMQINIAENATKNGAAKVKFEVLSAGAMVIQTGANSGEQISIDIPRVDAKGLKVDNLIMYTHEYAGEAISRIDDAIKEISNIRSKLGAYENRLEGIYDNLEVQSESITAAFSRIMDTDMAEEMTNYTQQDVLAQAAISMMKKSNERPESILQLLQ